MCIHIFEEEFAEKLSDALAVGTDSVLISKQKRRKIEHINKHYPFDI